MKKIYLFVFFICCYYNTFAQRDYVAFNESDYKSDTIRLDDCTYVCDTLLNYQISLYNKENHPGRESTYYKDGSIFNKEGVELIELTQTTNSLLNSIVDEAFTQAQVEQIDGRRLIIFIDVSSSDGTVTDVYFSFSTNDYYAQIPPEVYREMELRFKNEIQVELTNEGRKVDHCSLAWLQCPKGREDSGMTMPEDGGGMLTMPGGKLDGTIGGSLVGGQVAP